MEDDLIITIHGVTASLAEHVAAGVARYVTDDDGNMDYAVVSGIDVTTPKVLPEGVIPTHDGTTLRRNS